MSSEYISGVRAFWLDKATGICAIQLESASSNTHPRTPRWSFNFIGTVQDAVRYIWTSAYFADDGSIRGDGGRYLGAGKFADMVTSALSAPFEWPEPHLRIEVFLRYIERDNFDLEQMLSEQVRSGLIRLDDIRQAVSTGVLRVTGNPPTAELRLPASSLSARLMRALCGETRVHDAMSAYTYERVLSPSYLRLTDSAALDHGVPPVLPRATWQRIGVLAVDFPQGIGPHYLVLDSQWRVLGGQKEAYGRVGARLAPSDSSSCRDAAKLIAEAKRGAYRIGVDRLACTADLAQAPEEVKRYAAPELYGHTEHRGELAFEAIQQAVRLKGRCGAAVVLPPDGLSFEAIEIRDPAAVGATQEALFA